MLEKIEKYFRVLTRELEKKGEMKGVIVELTTKILKNLKDLKENEKFQKNY